MDEKRLLELKKSIDEAKTKSAELEGTRKHLMKELKDDWECSSLEEAEEKVKTMEEKIQKLNQTISDGVQELEEKYDF